MLPGILCAFATAILVLSLTPAWSKTERIVLRGNTFLFEISDNLSSSPANSSGYAVTFVSAAVLTGIAAFAIFEVANPYPGYASGARFNATMESLGAWFVAVVAGLVIGSVATKLIRPKGATTLT
jgi:hypothetical protein